VRYNHPMPAAYPWSTRPEDLPLTAEEVCGALYEAEGDITAASIRLKVGSLILRKFIERSSRARATIREMDMRLADKARSKLAQALDDEDNRRVDWAIRYVLNSKNARPLGWASSDPSETAQQSALAGPMININLPPAQWADGTLIGPPAPAKAVIELHPTSLPSAPQSPPPGGADDD
jgi:hypothetical protein